MKLSKMASVTLGVWLILKGIMPLLHLTFSGSAAVLSVLALTAGILVIIDR